MYKINPVLILILILVLLLASWLLLIGYLNLLLKFLSKNLSMCLHFDESSDLLFMSFPLLFWRIISFSAVHRSHLRDPPLYGAVVLMVFQLTSGFFPLLRRAHTSFDSSVSFSYFLCLKDFVWLLYLSLNWPSQIPTYSDCVSSHFTIVLHYTGIYIFTSLYPLPQFRSCHRITMVIMGRTYHVQYVYIYMYVSSFANLFVWLD